MEGSFSAAWEPDSETITPVQAMRTDTGSRLRPFCDREPTVTPHVNRWAAVLILRIAARHVHSGSETTCQLCVAVSRHPGRPFHSMGQSRRRGILVPDPHTANPGVHFASRT